MIQLLKRDLLISGWQIVTIFLYTTLMYVLGFPLIFLFIVNTIALTIFRFFGDYKTKINQFIMSLPIANQLIVRSRYILALIELTILLMFTMSLNYLASFINGIQHISTTWEDILAFFTLGTIAISFIMPIYYGLRSFIKATSVVLCLFFAGSIFLMNLLDNTLQIKDEIIINDLGLGLSLWIKTMFPWQPLIIAFVIATILFLISIKISEVLFNQTSRV